MTGYLFFLSFNEEKFSNQGKRRGDGPIIPILFSLQLFLMKRRAICFFEEGVDFARFCLREGCPPLDKIS